jgi:CRISPR-associated endonuclease Cas1
MAAQNGTDTQPQVYPEPAQPHSRVHAPAITSDDVAEGRHATLTTYTDTTIGPVFVVDGFGVTVRVNKGALECTDGIGDIRRVRRVARSQATAGQLRRVLVMGDGIVTTDAAGWCHKVGAVLVVAGRNGDPLMVGTPDGYTHGGLRRAQALAPFTPIGIGVTQYLLGRRFTDQARITRELLAREDRAAAIDEHRAQLDAAATPDAAILIELQAAQHYWAAWADELRLRFRAKDRPRVPEHWVSFGARTSPLNETPSNRNAATPVNALLNLGYRLAEIEATIACHGLGLDPAMGFAHADRAHRPAFVLDLMEAARGLVEETVWRLSTDRHFCKADFAELPTGQVRVQAPLTHDLAQALLPALRDALAPITETVASMIAAAATSEVQVPTPLTRTRHKTAQATARGQAPRPRPSMPSPATQLYVCPGCGNPVANRRHVRCAVCMAADPSHTAEKRSVRGRAIAARKQAQKAWEEAGGYGTFDPTIWPDIHAGLTNVTISDIVAATGLSKSFVSRIRTGHHRPHPSHWPALAALAHAKRVPLPHT